MSFNRSLKIHMIFDLCLALPSQLFLLLGLNLSIDLCTSAGLVAVHLSLLKLDTARCLGEI